MAEGLLLDQAAKLLDEAEAAGYGTRRNGLLAEAQDALMRWVAERRNVAAPEEALRMTDLAERLHSMLPES